ncbi:MAG: ABC transporter ATP-binding protein [Chitinophagales bacterium]|nr:ABC transporter ATP-binding protein [Chitinophagales bacterium]MDW8418235.1 ABC transporter ATP-binding protein [Chitinophagales bacterium]
MGQTVISVEGLYKQYRLGLVSTGTLVHDLNRWWHLVRGKEDPYQKITITNNRSQRASGEYVWALQNINFEVKQGEVLGIIGRNGAGKSTLLKILSKITGPTKGQIKIKGRVASLLEVGTGFQPELTGRDNIFLNGAILGMTKAEIKRKFDEIVDFSGVEQYIDTPVKRYSSGMYVRLAFAVAAHLEPEILVVDEVLAVGDAEFQRKCLGKMKDVSFQGRTVLFVSHNMTAVESLCSRAIMLKEGMLEKEGTSTEVVDYYLNSGSFDRRRFAYTVADEAPGNYEVRILSAAIENTSSQNPDDVIDVTSSFDIAFKIINTSKAERLYVGFDLCSAKGDVIFGASHTFAAPFGVPVEARCHIPEGLMNDGYYSIYVYIYTSDMRQIYKNEELLTFQVRDVEREMGFMGKINGMVRPKLNWHCNVLSA